jgi:hypothetical protein
MDQLYAKRLEVASDLLLHTGFSIAKIAELTSSSINSISRAGSDKVSEQPFGLERAFMERTAQQAQTLVVASRVDVKDCVESSIDVGIMPMKA